MYISFAKTMPNGSAAVKHIIRSINVSEGQVLVAITSYTQIDQPCWAQDVLVPLSILSSDPENSVANYLISANQYLAGGTIFSDPPVIDVLRKNLKSQVDLYKEQQIAMGCQTPFGVVDSDDTSLRNIIGTTLGALIAAVNNRDFTVNFRIRDNREIDIDKQGIIEVGLTTLAYVNNCYQRSFAIKNLIDESEQTIESLRELEIPVLWETILNPPAPTPTSPPA